MEENITFLDDKKEENITPLIDEKSDKLILPDWDLLPPFSGINRGESSD